jgi:hypothetical protein
VSFPFDLHSTAVFDSQYHAVPLPCHEYAFLKVTSQGHGRFVAGSRQGDGMGAPWELHVGYLPAFGVFLLPRGVPGSLLSEACQYQMQVVSVKQTTFVMEEEKLIILVQGHECLCNLQHSDYNNNFVKFNFLEIHPAV